MNHINAELGRHERLTALLHDAPKAEDHDGVRKFVRALTELGCAPLFVWPMSKLPADVRTSRQRSAARKKAQQAAREAGRRGWERVKEPSGVHLATTDAAVVDGFLDLYVAAMANTDRWPGGVPVNMAMSPGPSRLVVVDCDTAGQVAAFLADMGMPAGSAPTVRTPGAVGPGGEWTHSEGGHWWFTVPNGVQLPDNVGALTDPDGAYTVMWGPGRYALVPPSVREEGTYVAAGEVCVLPSRLAERITAHAAGRAARARGAYDRARAGDDPITAWGAGVTWAGILAGTDWTGSGKTDSCGCDIWTAPGEHASSKSATAHEPGCAVADSDDPCLHIWTDHDIEPFGEAVADHGPHLTRLRAYSAIHHDNDTGGAMTALDLYDEDLGFDPGVHTAPVTDTATSAPADDTRADDTRAGGQPGDRQSDVVRDAKADLRRVLCENAEVFEFSPVLAHIKAFADSRSAGPFAVLNGVFLQVTMAVSPRVVLPATVGDAVSLNLLTASVGDSSGGKGSCDKAAVRAVRMAVGNQLVRPLDQAPLGTGEGINRRYATSSRDRLTGLVELRWRSDRALFGCRDIGTIVALQSRKGATLMPELLKAYMGEELGFANADDTRCVIIPMHRYRFALTAGVQPENGQVLLSEQARIDGVPQRFLWAPVRPGVARAARAAGQAQVDPITVTVPDFGIDPMATHDEDADNDTAAYGPAAGPLVHVEIATGIAQQIIDTDAAKDLDPFGTTADPLAGHRLLTQLKVAAALASLHGHEQVEMAHWEIAQRLLAVSTATADVVAVASHAAAERDAGTQGALYGHKLAAADEARDTRKLSTVRDKVVRILGQQTDWVSRSTVRKGLIAKQRDYFDDAVAALVAEGVIQARDIENTGQSGSQYRLGTS